MATISSHNQSAGCAPIPAVSFKNALPMVLFMTGMFLANYISRQFVGPLLPAMETELGFNHAQAGLLMFFIGLAAFASQLGAGPLAARLDYHKVITISFFGNSLALAAAGLSHSFWTLTLACAFQVLLGGLYITSAIALITRITERRHWGKAMGIHEFAPNLGLMLAPFLAAWFLEIAGWRAGYFALSALMGLVAVIFFFKGPGRGQKAEMPNFSLVGVIVTKKTFWLLTAITMTAICIEIGIYNLLPLFLVNERGFELTSANYLVGMSRVPALVMVLLAGWIADRLGLKLSIGVFMGLTGICLTYLGIAPVSTISVVIILQASVGACIFPPILAAVSAMSKPKERVLTMGLVLGVGAMVGMGAMPGAVAMAGELGSFGLGICGLGVLTLLSAPLVIGLDLENTSSS